jgi:hypothetical protein
MDGSASDSQETRFVIEMETVRIFDFSFFQKNEDRTGCSDMVVIVEYAIRSAPKYFFCVIFEYSNYRIVGIVDLSLVQAALSIAGVLPLILGQLSDTQLVQSLVFSVH